jgi:hypothetical protein
MPIRVLVVVVNPKLAEWAVSSASNVAGDRWTLADAAEDARLAVGISAPLQAAPDSGAGLSGALDVLTAVPAPAHLFAEDGSIAPRACGPRTPPEHLTRERRVALGVRDDGAALFVLAHFDGVGEAAAGAPLGTTVPELASIMHALGVRRGAMLATGAAAQLLVRPGTDAGARRWPGDAGTPVGLTLRGQPRTPHLNAGDLVSRP